MFIYNLENIRNLKLYFKIEGELLGFNLNNKKILKTNCYFDFGLKFKLKGYLKNFVLWSKIFKNTLYLNSLFLKKNITLKDCSIGINNLKAFNSLSFNHIFVNNYKFIKKYYFYKLYDKINLMNYEKYNNNPINFIDYKDNWFFMFMHIIKLNFFNKLYDLLKKLSLIKKINVFFLFIKKNKKNTLFKNLKFVLTYKKNLSLQSMQIRIKSLMLKRAFTRLRLLNLKFKRKKKKFKLKPYKRIFKQNKINNFGFMLCKKYKATYVNNYFSKFLYHKNLKFDLKAYYDFIPRIFKKRFLNNNNYVKNVFLKKRFNIFNYLIFSKKNYLNLLNNFFLIKMLFNKFKYILIKLINKNNY